MPGTTPKFAIPYPTSSDTVDVPRDIKASADRVDAVLGPAPAGGIMMWPGTVAPVGWYLLNGTATAPAATNPTLATMFGQTGGNVNLPNWSDRFPASPGTDNGAAVLANGGETRHLLSAAETGVPPHGHADTIGVGSTGSVHHHRLDWVTQTSGAGTDQGFVSGLHNQGQTSPSGDDGSHTHNKTGSVTAHAGTAATSHENRPKFVTTNFIIKGG